MVYYYGYILKIAKEMLLVNLEYIFGVYIVNTVKTNIDDSNKLATTSSRDIMAT